MKGGGKRGWREDSSTCIAFPLRRRKSSSCRCVPDSWPCICLQTLCAASPGPRTLLCSGGPRATCSLSVHVISTLFKNRFVSQTSHIFASWDVALCRRPMTNSPGLLRFIRAMRLPSAGVKAACQNGTSKASGPHASKCSAVCFHVLGSIESRSAIGPLSNWPPCVS